MVRLKNLPSQNPLKRVFQPYPGKAIVVELAEKPLVAAGEYAAGHFKGHIVLCPDNGGHDQRRSVF
jgi:hypothetical protein